MSTAENLLREGRLEDAISVLGGVLRDDPTHIRNRTFLFELLCFAGEYERAGKQLDLLASASKDAMLGALNYQAALNAERTRQQMFEESKFQAPAAVTEEITPVRGSINGRAFDLIADADPRIGAALELFVAGDYLKMPFREISYIEMQPPTRLRDLLWSTVTVHTSSKLGDRELNDVFMPVLYPLSWAHSDDRVRLGRMTEWCQDQSGEEAPYGQKMLMISGEEFPILELRRLEIETPVEAQ